ncbi:hypothetical protein J6590_091671 [Homalodisca vitripennis]|nr:hypothetical protein J6590_091671 [Homalodisca vitripennis]
MVAVTLLVMLVVSCTPLVSGICSPRLQEKLQKIWHGEPLEEIVENWMAGKLTTVYISPALVEAQPGLHDGDALKSLSCYQTVVGKDGVSTTDYWYYNNKTAVAANYDIVMEVPAIVTVIEGSYTAGVMIRVLNYDKNKNCNQTLYSRP